MASRYLGKKFIGIDNCREYIDFAEDRVKNFMNEEKRISEELKLHKVEKTFSERKRNVPFYREKFKN